MTNSKDRLIVITGASGGLGSGLVENLLNAGHRNLVMQYRTCGLGYNDLMDIASQHELDELRIVRADLTDEASTHLFAIETIANWGAPWALINLAGASTNVMSWKMTAQEFKDIVDANLLTTFMACKEFIPSMREAGRGRIINTSSIVGSTGVVGAAHYCAAKAGIIGLTKALALELAPKNITVNAMSLGYFDCGLIGHLNGNAQTSIIDKTPLKKLGTTREMSGLVRFLISDDSSFTTGQSLHMNGGLF